MSGNFELDISRFIDHVHSNVNAVVREVVLELGARIVERSPVGDATYWANPAPAGYVGGHFRANWQYGFDRMPQGEIAGTDESLTAALGGIPANTTGMHYLINNTPYSIILENGWSEQAPHGIIARAIQEFDGIVSRAAR